MSVKSPTSIYDKNLKLHGEVSFSAFAYLFSEMIQFSLKRANNSAEKLEKQLEEFGFPIGMKILELTSLREKRTRRDIQIIDVLSFIHGPIWKNLFNKQPDGIEKSDVEEDEYMINEREPICNRFITLPKDIDPAALNCASFVAGIIEGILYGSNFEARVTAHTQIDPPMTIYLIKFAPSVIEREKQLAK